MNGQTSVTGEFAPGANGKRGTELGISPDYLADAVKAFKGSAVTVGIENENAALAIRAEADPDYRAIVMPIRL